jgi:hypothetical protein
MKTRLPVLLTALGLALALPSPGLFAGEVKTTFIPGREVVTTAFATVKAINLETRELTLQGRDGAPYTVVADPKIKRLSEVHVGDDIVLDYSISIAAEIRPPTAEELAHPYKVVEDTTKAKPTEAPSVEGYKIIEAVVTIEEIDGPHQTVTVKGPKGNHIPIKVKARTTLDKLHVGSTALVVYTESFALRLEKAPAKPTVPLKP